MKYVKKPAVVEAFQLGIDEQPDWVSYSEKILPGNIALGITIFTPEGKMTAHKGDMIIKGIQGEIYLCKKDIFDATYEEVENKDD
jgi:hypothetical protein